LNIFKAFLIRRIQYFYHHFLLEISISLLLPFIFMFSIGFVMSDLSPNYDGFVDISWILIGIVFCISFSSSFLFVYNDMQINIINKFLDQINISPISQVSFIFFYLLSIAPLELIKSFLTLIILNLLIGVFFPIYFYVIFLFLVFINIFLAANLGFAFGILNLNYSLSNLITFSFLLFIFFSSCWLFPINFFPIQFANIIQFVPTYLIAEFLRSILFQYNFDLILLFSIIFFGLINYMLNIYIFSKKLNN